MRKLIYIMGCAHCGSTLLTTLLGKHSQIATVGELKMTAIPTDPAYLCGCGEPLSECRFWRSVAQYLGIGSGKIDFQNFGTHYRADGAITSRAVGACVRGRALEALRSLALSTGLPPHTALKRVTNWNQKVIEGICEIQGKPVFLDGSKDPLRLLHFSRSAEFDVRGIHLIRDGRAILASHKKRIPETRANLISWRHKMAECEQAKALVPHQSMFTLRYEDLCESPAETLQEIFAYLNLPDESDICLNLGSDAANHILGHNSRLKGPREIRLSRDWEQLLTPDDLADFSSFDPGYNRKYRYC